MTPIEPGMIISDEPAIYRENEYGIRIENIILCREDGETPFGKFLKFETLSLCYIDRRLIDKAMLTREEIRWINDYHSTVYAKISSFLTEPERAWLKEKTTEIEK
jgi:Xaa-Pro aminopeptidase